MNIEKDVWKSILSCGAAIDDLNIHFQSSFIRTVANGNNILFRKDIWLCSGIRLKDKFSRLYALETIKDASLSERWCCFNGVWAGLWSWIINPRGRSKSHLELFISYWQGVELRVGAEDRLMDGVDESPSIQSFFGIQYNSSHKVWHASGEDKAMELGVDTFSTIQSCLCCGSRFNFKISADWKSWVLHPLQSFLTNIGT
ncbi:hypothetical protein Tco_0371893 [Tanacetum coccineum]